MHVNLILWLHIDAILPLIFFISIFLQPFIISQTESAAGSLETCTWTENTTISRHFHLHPFQSSFTSITNHPCNTSIPSPPITATSCFQPHYVHLCSSQITENGLLFRSNKKYANFAANCLTDNKICTWRKLLEDSFFAAENAPWKSDELHSCSNPARFSTRCPATCFYPTGNPTTLPSVAVQGTLTVSLRKSSERTEPAFCKLHALMMSDCKLPLMPVVQTDERPFQQLIWDTFEGYKMPWDVSLLPTQSSVMYFITMSQ